MHKTHNIGPHDVTCSMCKPIMVMAAVFGVAMHMIMCMYDAQEITGEA